MKERTFKVDKETPLKLRNTLNDTTNKEQSKVAPELIQTKLVPKVKSSFAINKNLGTRSKTNQEESAQNGSSNILRSSQRQSQEASIKSKTSPNPKGSRKAVKKAKSDVIHECESIEPIESKDIEIDQSIDNLPTMKQFIENDQTQDENTVSNRPKRKTKGTERFDQYLVDQDSSRKKQKTKKSQERGWYRVDNIVGMRVQRQKNKDQMQLCVKWEGYTKPSWESFTGFVKDTAHLVERYLIKTQLRPYQKLRAKEKELEKMQRDIQSQFQALKSAQKKISSLQRGTSNYSVGNMTMEDIEKQTNLLISKVPSLNLKVDPEDKNNDSDNTLTEYDGECEFIGDENMDQSSQILDDAILDSSKAESKFKATSKTDPSFKSVLNEEVSSNSTSNLSIEQQVALGKFVVSRMRADSLWSRIILKIGKKTRASQSDDPEKGQTTSDKSQPINGYNLVATNAATGDKVSLVIDCEAIEKQDPGKVAIALMKNGVQVAEKDVEMYFLHNYTTRSLQKSTTEYQVSSQVAHKANKEALNENF